MINNVNFTMQRRQEATAGRHGAVWRGPGSRLKAALGPLQVAASLTLPNQSPSLRQNEIERLAEKRAFLLLHV